jgi:type II secretory pathway predicted ATPase ExeA
MGLHRDPFSAEKDLLFYFAVDSFEQRVSLLKRLLRGRDALILVLGESGSGKTTLLKRFLDATEIPWRSGRIRTRSNRSAKLETLDNHPVFIVKDPRYPTVLFDNAHRLSRDELRYLLQDILGPKGSRKIKRLVLFGEPALTAAVTAMSDELIGKAAVNKIYIPVLNLEESGNYLRHRLLMAGYAGKTPFNRKVLQRLHRLSGGIPGKLNAVADSWLEKHNPAAPFGIRPWLRGTKAKWFWGAAAALVVLLLGSFLLRSPGPSRSPSQALSVKGSHQKVMGAKIPDRRQSGAQRAAVTPLRPLAEIAGSGPAEAEPPLIEIPDRPRPAHPETTAAIAPEPAAGGSEKPAVPGNERQTARQNPTPAPPALQGEAWLLAQNPGHFTLQILGVGKEDSLKRFVAENPSLNKHPMAYYRTRYRGKAWYPLLCGVYPTEKEARTAIQSLPDTVRRSNPWIREFAGIQTAIRKHRP